jgi:hypothetical protein
VRLFAQHVIGHAHQFTAHAPGPDRRRIVLFELQRRSVCFIQQSDGSGVVGRVDKLGFRASSSHIGSFSNEEFDLDGRPPDINDQAVVGGT